MDLFLIIAHGVVTESHGWDVPQCKGVYTSRPEAEAAAEKIAVRYLHAPTLTGVGRDPSYTSPPRTCVHTTTPRELYPGE